MAEPMKKTAAVLLGAGMLLGMTGCAVDNADKVRDQAEFIKVCKDNGGEPWINMLNIPQCNMDPATEDD